MNECFCIHSSPGSLSYQQAQYFHMTGFQCVSSNSPLFYYYTELCLFVKIFQLSNIFSQITVMKYTIIANLIIGGSKEKYNFLNIVNPVEYLEITKKRVKSIIVTLKYC